MIYFSFIVFVILLFVIYLISTRYKHCPVDKILVIYGKVGSAGESMKLVHDGTAFIIPIIQNYKYLDLTPIEIEVDGNFLTKLNHQINLKSKLSVVITTNPRYWKNAAERLTGLEPREIKTLAINIIYSEVRKVFAQSDKISLITDKEKLLQDLSGNIELELNKIGMNLKLMNISEITNIDSILKS
ncbi:MAG: hypothetical protein DRI95_15215 [Bacteroidetes bacterium]|nr:MAG: hypothetical protein DRI95_15215 [Bacteroidota bacterium]